MILLDPTGRAISLDKEYQRIVCLVPSITDLLCTLGLGTRLVGVTSFCVHPSHIKKTATVIGGTKTPRLDRIEMLKPDLVIGNKEENNKKDVIELEKLCPVYVSVVKTAEDNDRLISDLGVICKLENKANKILAQIESERIAYNTPEGGDVRALYFIWKGPYMCAGGDTFVHTMMEEMGVNNVLADRVRYPQFTPEELLTIKPDLVFLSSEPYPFKDSDIAEFEAIWPEAKVILVNGEQFSWYGSRISAAYAYFNQLWQQIAP